MKESNKKEESNKKDIIQIVLIAISLFLIFFSAVYIANYYSHNDILIHYPKSSYLEDGTNKSLSPNEVGDSIGGILNPIIAFTASIITFLAFYVQFKANKQQREQFEIQLTKEKENLTNELKEQKEQEKLSQFENQFYEMLRLHKENVNEIFIKFTEYRFAQLGRRQESFDTMVYGRKNFEYMLEEFEIAYLLANDILRGEEKRIIINHAYSVFFHGIKFKKLLEPLEEKDVLYVHFINSIITLKNSHEKIRFRNISETLKNLTNNKIDRKNKNELKYNIFEGYASFLGHYYRHLFQTVKLVVSKGFLSYEEKRKYLRILRAQLSNQEQVMLYYNWKAGYGHKWEDDKNKFFTDYRMIHNISNDMLFEDFKLEDDSGLKNKKLKKEKGRKIDPLFEFQD